MQSNKADDARCKNILIVEDDEGIRKTLSLALELEGYKVATAANGREAFDLLPQMQLPCLILLDLMMPVMNGWEFVQILKEDVTLATIPVVVVTAYGTHGIESKTQGLIKKPINLDKLLEYVRQYCGTPE